MNSAKGSSAIPAKHKFSAVAFDDCIQVKLSKPCVELIPGLFAYGSAPFELPKHWRDWIGSLRAGHFAEANLIVIVMRQSDAPDVLDHETIRLERELTTFVFGLMLAGVPDYRETVWFSGGNADGDVVVRSTKHLDMYYRLPGQPRPVLDDGALVKAAQTGARILALFGSGDYQRVRVGFNKLIDGLRSRSPSTRLHEFVRSIDGLMALEAGKSTKQFVHRGMTFASFPNGSQTCRTFYDLRSAEEHLNPWGPILDPAGQLQKEALDALGLTWADAAQALATDVYRRLLTNPALLSEFKDESSTKAFWALPDHERLARWGKPLNLPMDSAPFELAVSLVRVPGRGGNSVRPSE